MTFGRTLSSIILVHAGDLVDEFQQVFSEWSGETNLSLILHKIKVTREDPVPLCSLIQIASIKTK